MQTLTEMRGISFVGSHGVLEDTRLMRLYMGIAISEAIWGSVEVRLTLHLQSTLIL